MSYSFQHDCFAKMANEKKSHMLTQDNLLYQEYSWYEKTIFHDIMYHLHMFVISFQLN